MSIVTLLCGRPETPVGLQAHIEHLVEEKDMSRIISKCFGLAKTDTPLVIIMEKPIQPTPEFRFRINFIEVTPSARPHLQLIHKWYAYLAYVNFEDFLNDFDADDSHLLMDVRRW